MRERQNMLLDFLLTHGQQNSVSFHMPGHKGARLYRENGYGEFLEAVMDCDITEIPGADNLFQPETLLRTVMDRYKRLYDTEESYLLINGSSCGLIAAVLASVPEGGSLIMARNCHKSVFNALTLGDIRPVYAYPRHEADCGISGAIEPEEIRRCLDENPEAAAVILPSPNYYGICSDVKTIAEIVHQRGKILIIDQAHGAHLKFFGLWAEGYPKAAEEQGADLVVNSIHKTLASFTQTALLNVCTKRTDRRQLEDKLQTLESSSPSYPLMTTLDINADLLERRGESLIQNWAADIAYFYEEAKNIEGLKILERPDLDKTKLNLDMSARGLSGNQLEKLLMEEKIFSELTTGAILMCMTGIGNRRDDYRRLLRVLKKIGEEYPPQSLDKKKAAAPFYKKMKMEKIPAEKERILLSQAEERVCAAAVIPYPPGIPVLCPGEVFEKDVIEYIEDLRKAGEKIIGLDEEGKVTVGRFSPDKRR